MDRIDKQIIYPVQMVQNGLHSPIGINLGVDNARANRGSGSGNWQGLKQWPDPWVDMSADAGRLYYKAG